MDGPPDLTPGKAPGSVKLPPNQLGITPSSPPAAAPRCAPTIVVLSHGLDLPAAIRWLRPKSERMIRQTALVSVICGEEFDGVFAESALVHFTAPGHIDDVLRDFFAHGISVGRFGELTAGQLNLLPSIVKCPGNDFDSLRIENDRRMRELQDLRHGDPLTVQAGAQTGYLSHRRLGHSRYR